MGGGRGGGGGGGLGGPTHIPIASPLPRFLPRISIYGSDLPIPLLQHNKQAVLQLTH